MQNISGLQALLNEGHFVITTEVGPPKGASVKSFKRTVKRLTECCDAVNITDNQAAVVRLSGLAGAVHALAEGAEPVLHMTCRDRNRIGLQSDLLGAYSLGIRNLLLLTGDSPAAGNHPEAKPVFDIDSIGLCRIATDMSEHGRFMNGDIMRSSPKFFVGCGEDPFKNKDAPDISRLLAKADAGAHFVQTQPIFDLERFEAWMKAVEESGLSERIFVLAGILPIRSRTALSRMAAIPGIHIPDDLYARFKGLTERQQAEEGLRLAAETASRVSRIRGVSGLHIMAIGWHDAVGTIAGAARLSPRSVAMAAPRLT